MSEKLIVALDVPDIEAAKKMVEGLYNENDRALLIEDVVVYGTGSIEAAQVGFVFRSKIA